MCFCQGGRNALDCPPKEWLLGKSHVFNCVLVGGEGSCVEVLSRKLAWREGVKGRYEKACLNPRGLQSFDLSQESKVCGLVLSWVCFRFFGCHGQQCESRCRGPCWSENSMDQNEGREGVRGARGREDTSRNSLQAKQGGEGVL